MDQVIGDAVFDAVVFDHYFAILKGDVDQVAAYPSASVPARLHESVTVVSFVKHSIQPNVAVRRAKSGLSFNDVLYRYPVVFRVHLKFDL